MNRLSRRFRRTFSARTDESQDKNTVKYKVVLLDGSDLSFDLPRKCRGCDLLEMVFKSLDLVEKDYFGLQYMDTNQILHWLDPEKKIKKQVKIGKPYTLHFRVKFYAADPDNLNEELTRYHFYLQIKTDILKGKFNIPCKMAIELASLSLQSDLGDYDAELHGEDYISEFQFLPHQTKELERLICKQHKKNVGFSPADCESSYLRLAKTMEYYGIDMHSVMGENNVEFCVGLTPKGIVLIREMQIVATFTWPKVNKIMFKKKTFILEVQDSETPSDFNTYKYTCATSKASKHLWKCAIEHHVFFRLIKPAEKPTRTQSFLRMGSRFRYSGRTEYQASKEAKINARKSQKFERARSERFSKRSTIGYIRVGSRVWAKALNGDYYKGMISGLGEKVHIKFDNGDTIAHERSADDCVVYDKDPSAEDIVINMRVIGHWPGVPAKLSGTVIKIENNRYYVHYDDGDKGWNSLAQVRILKPPLYFGPGSNLGRKKVRKAESMKVTSLSKTTITTEIAPKSLSPDTPGSPVDVTYPANNAFNRTNSLPTKVVTEAVVVDLLNKEFKKEQELRAENKVKALEAKKVDDKGEKTKKTSKKEEVVDLAPKVCNDEEIEAMETAAKVTPPRPPLPKNVEQWNRNPSFAAATSQGMPENPPELKPTVDVSNVIAQNKSEYVTSRKVSVEKFKKTSVVAIPEEKPLNIPTDEKAPSDKEYEEADNMDLDKLKEDLKKYAIDDQRAFVVYVPEQVPKKWDYTKRTTYMGGLEHSNEDLLKVLLSPGRQRARRASLPASLNSSVDNLEEDTVDHRTKSPDNVATPVKRASSLNDLAKISPEHRNTPLNIDNFKKPSSRTSSDDVGVDDSWNDDRLPPITVNTQLQRSPSGRKFVQVTDL